MGKENLQANKKKEKKNLASKYTFQPYSLLAVAILAFIAFNIQQLHKDVFREQGRMYDGGLELFEMITFMLLFVNF